MFSKFEHDPPGVDNIMLCAGPKERQALAKVLRQQTDINDTASFIGELHSRVQEQADDITIVNDVLWGEPLDEEDADVDFDLHLSRMCPEDVAKVRKHLYVLFIDSCYIRTGVYVLDDYEADEEREIIFKDIIEPWLEWVRSAKQDKSTTEVSDKNDAEVSDKSTKQIETNSSDNKSGSMDKKSDKETNKPRIKDKMSTPNMFNQFKTEFESQPGIDSDNDIVLYATAAERYALQKALIDYMSANDAADLITEMHNMIPDEFPEGATHFYKLSDEDVEAVVDDAEELVTDPALLDTLRDFDDEQRSDLYNDVIKPWFQWLKEQKPKKANNNKKSNTTAGKKPHTKNNTNNTKNNNNTNNTNNTMDNTNTTSTTANMFGSVASIFSNMLGTLEPDMVRMTFDGNVAVKTTNGYKTYNVTKKKAVNMDSLVMPDMSAFLLLPSTKVKVGDIIMRDGTFYSIISVDDATNELVGYNYESGKKETLVRETHCFLGNTYFYSKLFSPVLSLFGNKSKSKPEAKKEEGSSDTEVAEAEDTMSMLLPLAMMSQNGDMNSILPMLLMSKMGGKEDSGMMKMLMLSGMMGGSNSNMNGMLPFMLMGGDFPAI